MVSERSIVERMEAVHHDLAALVEDMGEAVYCAIERETLKCVAIAAGIDHTIEATRIIVQLGAELQRERDVNRELRRQIKARPVSYRLVPDD